MASQWEFITNITINPNASNTTNGTFGKTRPPLSPLTNKQISLFILSILLSVCIVLGNSMVLAAFKVNRRLRTTPNYFIFSLDLFNGLISIPLYVTLSVARTIPHIQSLWTFYGAFDIICGTSSILNLTCISLERAYALLRPLQHRYINKGFIVLGIALSWSLAGLAGMAQTKSVIEVPLHGFTVTVVYFMFPLTIIMAAYVIIFKVARAHVRGRGVRSFKKDLRIAMTVALVTGLFILFWGPFFATNSFYALCRYLDSTGKLCSTYPIEISGFVKFLQCGSSACNPVIYGFRNNDFQRAFRKMFMRLICKKVPLTHFRGSTIAGATRRRIFERQDSSFEDSRSTIYRGDSRGSLTSPFDYRESYKKAIAKGCKKPFHHNRKRRLKDGLLSIGTEAFVLPINGYSAVGSTLSSMTVAVDNEVSLDGRHGRPLEESVDKEQTYAEKANPGIDLRGIEEMTEAVDIPKDSASCMEEQYNTFDNSPGGTNSDLQRSSPCDKPLTSIAADSSPNVHVRTLSKDKRKKRIQVCFKLSSKRRSNKTRPKENTEGQEEKSEKLILSHDNRGFSDVETISDTNLSHDEKLGCGTSGESHENQGFADT